MQFTKRNYYSHRNSQSYKTTGV